MFWAKPSVMCPCTPSRDEICPKCSEQLAQFEGYLNCNLPAHERAAYEPESLSRGSQTFPLYLPNSILEKMDIARNNFEQHISAGAMSPVAAVQVMTVLVAGFQWLTQILRLLAIEVKGGPFTPDAVSIIRRISAKASVPNGMFFCGQRLRNICSGFADVYSCPRAASQMRDAHLHFLGFLKALQVACYAINE
ncbi:hypothetical protein CVT24_012890 [Panaeolus cyanescens]|uniref:Uncharacterized protein n=1 Tax=Panaeolus cyanescens TaxID=181874 RepID=A0A409WUN4_9AGAR|nr:hypothetical protein CVT24_012890 [Panaeolus cyanescens]